MLYLPLSIKRCGACNAYFPATRAHFYVHGGSLSRVCKPCELQRNKTYKILNREKVNHDLRLWHQSHPEQSRAIHQKSDRKHPQTRRAKDKRQRKAHPEKFRAKNNRRYSRKRDLPATFTDADWNRALGYWHGTCAYCGHGPSLFDAHWILHQEHHIPQTPDYELKEPNPGYVPANILPACQDCNLNKRNKDPQRWLIERFGKRQAKVILNRIQEYFEWVQWQPR